ncbi:MAG: 4Fe-4S dicluster domain-containing protein [Clostridia bacterium]|nr:4Fe-4S dicluster domain-containing protein [Clostridia bacterium]
MAKLTIRKERCKSCGLCIGVCPKKILALDENILNEKGFHPVMITDEESCIGCAMCATMCPDVVIKVEK